MLASIMSLFIVKPVSYTHLDVYKRQVQTVTQELFSDPSGAADKVFSADVDKDAIPAMLDPVVTDSNVTIDGVSRSMTESTVYALSLIHI